MPFLTEPCAEYKEQFIEGIREFQREGKQLHYDIQRISTDFEAFLRATREQQEHVRIGPNRVPTTEMWLIDGDEYIGYLALRHELNDFLLKVAGHIGYMIRPSKRRLGYGTEILRLGLEQAKKLGLPRALVTCDENNIGSKKVIEHNGGKLENAVEVEGATVRKLRYWIDLMEQENQTT
ncbi:GNAT family N-acetyltransferase [Ktedonosporobacter rubrisoli]|uniref:GNAT family N-acetyltransferase n=1 Tax=Ktedonosporobacter rubrisoli TaxID=2509675 RepID=A0A4P6K091_KTERU|nr:GNAT family N-acetyltransferase [Ktedonosporobacter rubrisoli]QBD81537.1 GNAT family N-acetyltransferase [Ktedonosporobacter rubrisoli]